MSMGGTGAVLESSEKHWDVPGWHWVVSGKLWEALRFSRGLLGWYWKALVGTGMFRGCTGAVLGSSGRHWHVPGEALGSSGRNWDVPGWHWCGTGKHWGAVGGTGLSLGGTGAALGSCGRHWAVPGGSRRLCRSLEERGEGALGCHRHPPVSPWGHRAALWDAAPAARRCQATPEAACACAGRAGRARPSFPAAPAAGSAAMAEAAAARAPPDLDTDDCLREYRHLFSPDILAGRVAFITGGGSGIGFRIAEIFMRHGCRTVIASRDLQRVSEASKKLVAATGQQCLPLSIDVRQPQTIAAAVDEALKEFKRIDILINGAAGNFLCPASALSFNAFKTVIDIDTLGTFNTSKVLFEKYFRDHGGVIVNITATLSYRGQALQMP
ncbi:peroxisomal 2,4-dienoyl-CoA reductase [(3E)-enoyl-CoA-producing] isoform X2 [Strix uralensis]|uniref:peroxisomal 2,4-dienoyl-CoA reductase [(3E)-enoyl-CoA-producing] isoform X2 n=1 Tax=Strix uralensis TaxID=36305 RepID=UPI003DA242A2